MPFKKKKENRRQHVRITLCRLVKIQTPHEPRISEISHIYDLSESGLRFHVTDLSNTGFQISVPAMEGDQPVMTAFSSLQKGDSLSFQIKLDPEHPVISTSGKIAWVSREAVSGGKIRVKSGVEFVGLSAEDRKLIQIYVAAFKN